MEVFSGLFLEECKAEPQSVMVIVEDCSMSVASISVVDELVVGAWLIYAAAFLPNVEMW